jgi:hypothetical protein
LVEHGVGIPAPAAEVQQALDGESSVTTLHARMISITGLLRIA